MVRQRDFSDFTFELLETKEIDSRHLDVILSLFDGAYRQANHAYLEKSLTRLAHLAIVYEGDLPAGFALGEVRVMDLPRMPRQVVSLAGICCIDQRFRRRGLFGALESRALGASQVPPAERRLGAGRMAHPASFRGMSRSPNVVPKRGVRPTPWQQEVGQAVANAYGVHGFDPETFVCLGSGVPIGYPIIDVEAEPEEWDVFKPVNRDRGRRPSRDLLGPDGAARLVGRVLHWTERGRLTEWGSRSPSGALALPSSADHRVRRVNVVPEEKLRPAPERTITRQSGAATASA